LEWNSSRIPDGGPTGGTGIATATCCPDHSVERSGGGAGRQRQRQGEVMTNRPLRVVRIQLVNAPMVLGLPVFVLLIALLANIVIFAAIGEVAPPEGRVTGALMSIYIVVLIS